MARSVPFGTRFTIGVLLVVRLCVFGDASALWDSLFLCWFYSVGTAFYFWCVAGRETSSSRECIVPLGLAGEVGLLYLILNFTIVGIIELIFNLEVRWLQINNPFSCWQTVFLCVDNDCCKRFSQTILNSYHLIYV
jgi:hypothetical protein